jgi:hypothetical protein
VKAPNLVETAVLTSVATQWKYPCLLESVFSLWDGGARLLIYSTKKAEKEKAGKEKKRRLLLLLFWDASYVRAFIFDGRTK